jgi:hypothetical protein
MSVFAFAQMLSAASQVLLANLSAAHGLGVGSATEWGRFAAACEAAARNIAALYRSPPDPPQRDAHALPASEQ